MKFSIDYTNFQILGITSTGKHITEFSDCNYISLAQLLE